LNCSKFRRNLIVSALGLTLIIGLMAPASALLQTSDSSQPAVASFAKNGLAAEAISFTPEDFVVTSGSVGLSSVVIQSLPDSAAGLLMEGDSLLSCGDVVTLSAISGMRFYALSEPTVTETSFIVTPVFSDDSTGSEVTVSISLLSAQNSAPIAQDMEITTYKDVPITSQLAATDSEGDAVTFQLVDTPARGEVTISSDGTGTFTYSPYEGKKGKDTFTYVAIDTAGNRSSEATVKITINKLNTKVTYADMTDNTAQKAALRLAEDQIFVGECLNGEYFFCPDATVTRSEFLAMAMKVAGLEKLDDATITGFYDDEAIQTWAKGYVSSALKDGMIEGTYDDEGRIIFSPDANITLAEATVVLNRMLAITDVSTDVAAASFGSSVPAWALQSAVNLQSIGVITASDMSSTIISASITRGESAELLCSALEVLDQRNSDSSWFSW